MKKDDGRPNYGSSASWTDNYEGYEKKKIKSQIRFIDRGDGRTGTIQSAPKPSPDYLLQQSAINVCMELVDLLASKNADYGSGGIMDAPYGPINGLVTRLHDKVSRAATLTGKAPKHESLRDTFLDIANYGIIGLMVLDKTFPKK